jgi:GTP-binding protein
MKFVDSTQINVRSGDGGNGMVSFRAASNMPKLGADGGDGGHGGHVYLKGHKGLNTLSHLYYRRKYAAENGERGGSNSCTGASGDDMIVVVPLGTMATDLDTGEELMEVMEHDKCYRICEGGHRGLGNQRYLSSIHQAPEEFKCGTPGESKNVGLELKLIAEVGLAGFPNAGKSTLLSVISAAKPKVADYPFTTLEPNLGVVDMNGLASTYGASFVMADIPGLIEGASEGRGLGHDFLRHLERTKVIAYVIDEFSLEHEPLEALRTLQGELQRYSAELFSRPSVVILTKQDVRSDEIDEEDEEDLAEIIENMGFQVLRISAVSRAGLDSLKIALYDIVSEDPEAEPNEVIVTKLLRKLNPEADGYKLLVKSKSNAALGLS